MTTDPPGVERPPPGPIARRMARAPRYLYKLRLGRLLGRRFVLLHHTGRRSGLTRETVLEVVRHDATSLDVAAAWGPRSDWFRNLAANPAVTVDTGPLRAVQATAELVDAAEASDVFADYATRHPRAARMLASNLGLDFTNPRSVAETVPLVRFTLR